MPITTNSSGAGKSKRRAIALTAVTVAISARSVMATDTRASLHPVGPARPRTGPSPGQSYLRSRSVTSSKGRSSSRICPACPVSAWFEHCRGGCDRPSLQQVRHRDAGRVEPCGDGHSDPPAQRLVEPDDHVAGTVLGELHRLDDDGGVGHRHQRRHRAATRARSGAAGSARTPPARHRRCRPPGSPTPRRCAGPGRRPGSGNSGARSSDSRTVVWSPPPVRGSRVTSWP